MTDFNPFPKRFPQPVPALQAGTDWELIAKLLWELVGTDWELLGNR